MTLWKWLQRIGWRADREYLVYRFNRLKRLRSRRAALWSKTSAEWDSHMDRCGHWDMRYRRSDGRWGLFCPDCRTTFLSEPAGQEAK